MLELQVHLDISFCVCILEIRTQVLMLTEQVLLTIAEATWRGKGLFPILITKFITSGVKTGTQGRSLEIRSTAEATEKGLRLALSSWLAHPAFLYNSGPPSQV